MTTPEIHRLLARAAAGGTPAYVYLWDAIAARAEHLKRAFDGLFELSYAVKANPNPTLLTRLLSHVASLDVSSAGEVDIALRAGCPPSRLSFSGPAKTAAELTHAVAVDCEEIIVESVDEMEILDRIAASANRPVQVLVRVNPTRLPKGFGVGMARGGSQFGVDEEVLGDALVRLSKLTHLVFSGFHAYSGTQCLVPSALVENFANLAALFKGASRDHGLFPRRLVFGAGFGVPLDAEQGPLDLEAVAAETVKILAAVRGDPHLGAATMRLELGRYLVGEAGYYLTRVVRNKVSRGKTFVMCDGGLNQHLAATGHFGSVIRRNYPMFKVAAGGVEAETVKQQVVGPLCTTIDVLGADVELPRLAAGDLLAIASSGAYGLTASPVHFIHHPLPREVMVDGTGDRATLVDVAVAADRGLR